MAERLVVGIYPQSDPKAIESALSAQQIDLSKVKVVTSNVAGTATSPLNFISVVNDMESNSLSDDMTRGLGIIGDSGGTNVPGLPGKASSLESFSSGPEAPHYLDGYDIPDDEVDNFDEAVADGRAVVLYPAPADEQSVADAFKAAGLLNVRAY